MIRYPVTSRTRRRTRCIYCGQRIPGALDRARNPASSAERTELRRAARVACTKHLRLVAIDPEYAEVRW